jgi:hypothetical protein
MATSKWRSSLANAETALRRALGLSGPIDLDLSPALTPVVITADATRPGTASQLRGRRWRNCRTFSVNAAATGSYFLLCEEPSAQSSSRPNIFDGGVIIDGIQVTTNCAVANTPFHLALVYFPNTLILSPGIPWNPNLVDSYFVDPMRVTAEPAHLTSDVNGAISVTTNGGLVIWEGQISAQPGGSTVPVDIPADLFLNWRSGIAIGNRTASAQAVTLYVNVQGRIF